MKYGGHVFYLEQRVTDLPDNDDWLSSAEYSILQTFRVDKRRSDWRLGRWSAKRAVSAYLGWSKERLHEIEVRSLASGAPEVAAPGVTLAPEISISHSCDVCMCVVGRPGEWIGCDIEKLEARSEAFIETFFTANEVAGLAAVATDERKVLANIIWSTKESYLKSTREGLRRDTKDVGTSPRATSAGKVDIGEYTEWLPIWISDGGRSSVAYWRLAAGFVETVCRQGAGIIGGPSALWS